MGVEFAVFDCLQTEDGGHADSREEDVRTLYRTEEGRRCAAAGMSGILRVTGNPGAPATLGVELNVNF